MPGWIFGLAFLLISVGYAILFWVHPAIAGLFVVLIVLLAAASQMRHRHP